MKHSYDKEGNLITRSDAAENIREYKYNSLNLKIKETIKDSDGKVDQEISYVYNLDGELIGYQQNDGSGVLISSVENTLDEKGRAIESYYRYSKTTGGDTINFKIGQNFNKEGQLLSQTYPDGSSQNYRYHNGQLAEIVLPNKESIRFDDYKWMMPWRISTPSTIKEISYDNFQQIVGIKVNDKQGVNLLRRTMQYDAVGNIIEINGEMGETKYQYDQLDRLRQVSPDNNLKNIGVIQENYEYDSLGNRVRSNNSPVPWIYNSDNQLTKYPRLKPFGVDAAIDTQVFYTKQGHVQREVNDQAERIYEYNAAERLIRFTEKLQGDIEPALQVAYGYDPLGRRISKVVNRTGKSTWFIYSNNALMAEINEGGQIEKAYGFNPQAAHQGLWSTDPLWQAEVVNDGLTNSKTRYHYLHTDHLGSPILATTSDGQPTWKAVGESFGMVGVLSESIISMNLRFPGQYFDDETGTMYNLHRDYSPIVGRYIQSDPIGIRAGVSLYAYANLRPLTIIDSHGLQSFDRFNRCTKFRWGDYYNRKNGSTSDVINLGAIGLLDEFIKTPSVSSAMESTYSAYKQRLLKVLEGKCLTAGNNMCLSDNKQVNDTIDVREFNGDYATADDGDCMEPIGRGELYNKGTCSGSLGCNTGEYHGICSLHFYIRDKYKNPWDYYSVGEAVGLNFNTGTPYKIQADWFKSKSW